jgi:DNA-binding response OmpR family regulator
MPSFGIFHAPIFEGSAAVSSRAATLVARPMVAVIEDDPLMSAMIAAELQHAGFETTTFAGGEAALRQFVRLAPPAAVILDWQMPEVDGATVLQRLRTGGYTGPIIVFTADGSVRFSAVANGATDCFEKSQSFAPVLACLRQALRDSVPS